MVRFCFRDVLILSGKLASADDTETELFYNRLFIRRRNGETEESTVNGFLMKYGLQGIVVSSTLPKNAGLAALLLLPAVLSGSLWTEISREKKNYTVKDAEYWFCNLLYSVMAGTDLAGGMDSVKVV